MQSVRRAVLRSAASASAQVARATSTSTSPLVRSVAAKAVRMPVSNLAIAARYFSQTARVANAEEESSSPVAATEAPTAATSNEDPTPHGVFVRNIVFDASEANLQEAFEHYGTVNKTIIARDARGMSKGYGFVFFESAEAKEKALEEANGSFWHGRRLIVLERAARQPREGGDGVNRRADRPNRDPSDSLYIGNLPYETTDADLNVVFREVAGLKAVRVAVDRATGWPRGFAHADFDTVENAIAGLEFLKDKQIGTRTLRVDYASPSKNAGQRGFRGQRAEGAEGANQE